MKSAFQFIFSIVKAYFTLTPPSTSRRYWHELKNMYVIKLQTLKHKDCRTKGNISNRHVLLKFKQQELQKYPKCVKKIFLLNLDLSVVHEQQTM